MKYTRVKKDGKYTMTWDKDMQKAWDKKFFKRFSEICDKALAKLDMDKGANESHKGI